MGLGGLEYSAGLGSAEHEKHSLIFILQQASFQKGGCGEVLDEGQVLSWERCREGRRAQAPPPAGHPESARQPATLSTSLCQHHIGSSNSAGTGPNTTKLRLGHQMCP